jgi:hypothetical protein
MLCEDVNHQSLVLRFPPSTLWMRGKNRLDVVLDISFLRPHHAGKQSRSIESHSQSTCRIERNGAMATRTPGRLPGVRFSELFFD